MVITSRNYKLLIPFCILSIAFLALPTCISVNDNTITYTHHITDSQTLTSPGEVFKLGFFSPGNSTYRYVGIWYNKVSVLTVVWVANRDKPLNESSGVLKIANDGNLVVLDGVGKVYWSSNVSNIPFKNSAAELLDSGELILRQVSDDSKKLWESFTDPSDTFLPTMKIGVDRRSGKKIMLKSAKSESDPSNGKFTMELEIIDIPQLVIWNGTQRHRRTGPWHNKIFLGAANMYSVYLEGFYIDTEDQEGAVYLTYNYYNKSSYRKYALDYSGNLVAQRWDGSGNGWYQFLSTKGDDCSGYSKCGPFGTCNILDSPICSCLRGFMPKDKDEWIRGNWSTGCVRKTELQCQRNKNISNQVADEIKDGFLKLEAMKVPDFAYLKAPKDVNECQEQCSRNCSCLAFSYVGGIGCMIWGQTLLDMREYSTNTGVDLYIRVAHSELDQKTHTKVIIIITVLIGTVTISICAYLCWRWMTKQRGKQKKEMETSLFDIDTNVSTEYSDPNILGDHPDLKILKFETVAIATNHFGEANKLGEGGFGPVYKGMLLNGQEIAVKRLSKGSGQGLEEFKNEVVVISKLQHRNLVRLLGCCIEEQEKMLIYEYMLNKSLDAFLFDPTKRALLDWNRRFLIIEGISRGILYLHRDSRLRVIHRDLKASNILLDEDLNPKISDFGMARIFGGNELQAKTRRVVGTYGYMSPEYAMEGRFSEKSDVFSFGVLLLEIVSGARNSVFYHEDLLSLLGYAWQLWNEDKMRSLIDPTLLQKPYIEEEVLRCIHVGLLCVQEFAEDRPTMSMILSMLTSETTTLPTPKKPAFTIKRNCYESSPSQENHKAFSINTITMTSIEGR